MAYKRKRPGICHVEGCTTQHFAKWMCRKHWIEWLGAGAHQEIVDAFNVRPHYMHQRTLVCDCLTPIESKETHEQCSVCGKLIAELVIARRNRAKENATSTTG